MTGEYSVAERVDMDQLVIERPVFDAEKLVAAARHIGQLVFGEDSAGLIDIPNPQRSGELDIQLSDIVAVSVPRVRVVDPEQLKLRMFELWAPRELNHDGRFRNAAGKLIRRAERVYSPIIKPGEEPGPKYRTSTLYAMFDRIGFDFGVFDQTDVPIRCEALGNPVIPEDDERIHLSLLLHPTDNVSRMLNRQAKACLRGLGDISKRVTYPSAVSIVHVPFCSLPADALQSDYDKFVELTTEQVQDAQLRIGGVKPQVI